MERTAIHVMPHDKEWAVKNENADRITKAFSSKRDAIAFAYDIASNQDGFIVVHNESGQIERFKAASDTNKIIQWMKG